MTHIAKSRFIGSQRQRGLSLLEVVVAMGIGLLLIAGVTQLFIGSNQNFVVKDSVSRLQEEVRFAMDQFQRDMRMAGYQGCTRDVTDHLNPAGTNFDPFLLGNTAVFGWDYAFNGVASGGGSTLALPELTAAGSAWVSGTGPAMTAQLPANVRNNLSPGSDVFVVNLGEIIDVTINGTTAAPDARANLLAGQRLPVSSGGVVVLASGDCTVADRFQRTNSDTDAFIVKGGGAQPGNLNPNTTDFSASYDANATVIAYRSWVYFVRPTADDGPELARRQIGLGAPDAIESVAQGVENMQVLYGVSTGGLRNRVNQYVTAEDVTDWSDVLSVRIALLMRTTQPVNPDINFRTFNLLGTQINPSGADWDDTTGDRHIRLVATTTIGLRNRLE